MNIEVGKFYKTRDGRRARIYAVDGSEFGHIHGAISNSGGWYSQAWDANGQVWSTNGHIFIGSEACRDLIGEWVEPRSGTLWVNVYEHMVSSNFLTKERADICASNKTRLACIEVKWTEGEGL